MISLFLAALLSPAIPALPPVATQVVAPSVTWYEKGLQAAFADAKAQSRPLVVYFRSEVNATCQQMERETFADPRVVTLLAAQVCVRVDFDKQRDAADRYAVRDVPVVIWFRADGTPRDRIDGPQDAEVFLANSARIQADIGTIDELRRKIASAPGDLDARFELYRRLLSVGDVVGAEEQRAAIKNLDPQGTSRGSRQFRYKDITTAIEQHWAATGSLDVAKIDELKTFVEAQSDPEIVWDGWMRLSNTHLYWAQLADKAGETAKAAENRSIRRKYLANAWPAFPQDKATMQSLGVFHAAELWDQRAELSPDDKALFLKITERLIQVLPGEALPYDLHARACIASDRREDALASAKKAVEIDPRNGLYQERLKSLGGS
jgi:tetratricopeptide (TPR) repeat protein